jgi:hypothetical protein
MSYHTTIACDFGVTEDESSSEHPADEDNSGPREGDNLVEENASSD